MSIRIVSGKGNIMGVRFFLNSSSTTNLKKFMEIAFSSDNDAYQGNVFICTLSKYRDADGNIRESMKTVATLKTDEHFMDNFMKLKLHPNHDYYITKNAFSGYKREYHQLFQFKNIVIDIDAHMPLEGETMACRNNQVEKLYRYIINPEVREIYDLPCPNAVVFTGRGLQLWFCLEDASYKLAPVYNGAKDYIEGIICEMLRNNKDVSEPFTLDCDCNKKYGGLVRIPCTSNTKAYRKSSVEILHDSPYDIIDLYRKGKRNTAETKKKKTSGNKPCRKQKWHGSPDDIAMFRYEALSGIIKYRIKEGILIERDKFLFCAYASMSHSSFDEEERMSLIKEMNSSFPDPLPERQWTGYLKTSVRKHYKIKNSTIISMLSISTEEQDLFDFHPAGKKKEKKKKNKNNYLPEYNIDEKITKYSKIFKTKKDIATAIGCSEQTVARRLKKLDITTKKEKTAKKIKKAAMKGNTASFLMEKFGIGKTYAYETVKKAKETIARAKERKNREKLILDKIRKARSDKKNKETAKPIRFSEDRIILYRRQVLDREVRKIPPGKYNWNNTSGGIQNNTLTNMEEDSNHTGQKPCQTQNRFMQGIPALSF